MSSPSKRRDMDAMKLMMNDYIVEPINDGINKFNVEFHGPKESNVTTALEDLTKAEFGRFVLNFLMFILQVSSIGFPNKIIYPNIDELSGSVCLDVVNQSWSPMFDLLNVFEDLLPQLLLYPNPSHSLNGDAASLMMKDKVQYDKKVKEYCERYTKKEHIVNT